MPNHIKNKVTLQGDAKKVQEVIRFMGNRMDFNKIIACPKELEDESAVFGDVNPDFLQKYGASNWYDWRLANWGTKWNAYSMYDESEKKAPHLEGNTYTFWTAWACPASAIRGLSKMFPEVTFEILFADEDTGYNCGKYVMKDELVVDLWFPEDGSDEAEEFANDLWGE